MSAPLTISNLRMREVWAHNLEEECALIREVVFKYPYIAMDTEFPGVVARPVGSFKHQAEFHYQTLRCNVDMLKLIQLGLTFTDANGNLPMVDGFYCIWQFNFKEFNLKDELYAQDSIELLKQSGIDFASLEDRGIDVKHFGERLMVSGVVLNEEIRWLTFHSGYDFGYLLKLLTSAPLPDTEAEFFFLLRCYFPRIFDIKHLMQFVSNMHGGLSKLAEHLGVVRIGPQHQAGSDSLLTSHTFFKLQKSHFNGVDITQFAGVLHGFAQENEGLLD
jgi:CCR4-NOT transcription complex subunit 7/8